MGGNGVRQVGGLSMNESTAKSISHGRIANEIEAGSVDACRLIRLPVFEDSRGALSFVEGGRHVPFEIARAYFLYGIPDGAKRGAHAHKALQQLVIAIAGSFEVAMDDGRRQKVVRLDSPSVGLYICPMIWRDLLAFSRDAVCLVLASEPYDEADYFRCRDEYLAAIKERR